jgi:hypothetical protein
MYGANRTRMRRMKIGRNDEDDGKGVKKSGGQGRKEEGNHGWDG